MNSDGDIRSIVQWVMADLHTPGIEDIVRRYCVDAMEFHRAKKYFFSDRILRFNLTAGRSTYRPGDGFGLPADLVEIASRRIWVLIGGVESSREPCERSTTEVFEDSLAAWGDSSSQPELWDFRAGSLRLSPAPSSSDDVVELRYMSNLLIPKIKYDTALSTWAYYDPMTMEKITDIDSWSNDWTLQESGRNAIRMRTMYSVQKNYLRDIEGSQETLAGWLEAVGQLEEETEQKTAGISYLGGQLL